MPLSVGNIASRMSQLATRRWASTTSGPETSTTAGMLAARTWLTARSLSAPGLMRWNAEILLDVVDEPAREPFDERFERVKRYPRTAGAEAAERWLVALGLSSIPR